nr:transporter substrate-binding domain-containing protein [Massilia sp. PAMC28688]
MKQCALSDPIGSSRLGLAQLRQRPVAWDSPADLRPYRIGVVHGYINSEALDAAIAAGEQVSDAARDDAQNLRKLLGGRIDMAVIDAAVFAHLVSTDPQLRPHRHRLVFGQRLLETKKLYVCFRQDAQGRQLRDLFNEGRRKARP